MYTKHILTKTFAAFFVFIAAPADIAHAKLDLDRSYLTDKQKNDLTMQEFYNAYFENIMEVCGLHPDVENRVADAVRECVTNQTILRLRSEYREMKKRIKKTLPKIDCSTDKEQKWLTSTSKLIDKTIADYARRCHECPICGF